MVRLAPLGVKGEDGSALRSSSWAISERRAISLTASMIAETPRWVRLEWASLPVTVTLNVAIPLCPETVSMLVGSPTITTPG